MIKNQGPLGVVIHNDHSHPAGRTNWGQMRAGRCGRYCWHLLHLTAINGTLLMKKCG